MDFISNYSQSKQVEIVELGCGPARALKQLCRLNLNATITGVDVDKKFLDFARTALSEESQKVNLVNDNIATYSHTSPVDIFFSVGVHHHIAKGEKNLKYLQNVFQQLSPNGVYIVVDEFIPQYNNEEEREINLAIWYSHVIAHALKYGYEYLANEEARIFLDDIIEGMENKAYKSEKQIKYILEHVTEINSLVLNKKLDSAIELSKKMISFIHQNFKVKLSNDETLDISREDYKICFDVFQKEYEQVGFKLKEQKVFGNLDEIGAMAVYVLGK